MPSSWTTAEPSLPALTFTYSFGPGSANALALVVNGGVIVVSPPVNPPESAFTELEQHGPVEALVAPNAFHTMGIAPWKARYPSVPVFAPAQSIARVSKRSKDSGIRPVSELASKLGDKVEIIDMPYYKTGEALVRWKIDGGHAWFTTDVLMNLPEVPKGLFGMVFGWTKSAPGFRRNAIAGQFMVKEKKALYAWLIEQAEKAPPKVVVPCHGPVLRFADPVAEVRAALS